MRLIWSEPALDDLEAIAARAPRAAAHVFESVVWLAEQIFPRAFRRVEGRPKDHVQVVAPYTVVYRIDGEDLTVLRIFDGRRLLKRP